MHAVRMKLTTRRLMVLVAAAAVVLCATVHPGREPGVYFRAGGWRLGAWRDDGAVHGWDERRRPIDCLYEAGLWRGSDRMAFGVAYQGGKVTLAAGHEVSLLW